MRQELCRWPGGLLPDWGSRSPEIGSLGWVGPDDETSEQQRRPMKSLSCLGT